MSCTIGHDLGHKRIPSREGGIEIVLYNLRNKTKLNIEEVWMNHGKLMGKNMDLSVRQNDEVYTVLREQGITIKPALAGMTYDLDGVVFRILWPNEETLYNATFTSIM